MAFSIQSTIAYYLKEPESVSKWPSVQAKHCAAIRMRGRPPTHAHTPTRPHHARSRVFDPPIPIHTLFYHKNTPSEPPYGPEQLSRWLEVVPVMDLRLLQIFWPLPAQRPHYLQAPTR